MNASDLKKLGVESEDLIKEIIVLHGKDIEAHKSKIKNFEEVEVPALKQQITDANQQIESFKDMKKPEEVDAAISEWKTKAEQAERDAKESLHAYKFQNKLESKLKSEYKARDPKEVITHLDKSKLQYDDEKDDIIGLDEQAKPVKEKKTYLFEDDEETPEIVTGGQSQSILNDATVAATRKAAGLPEK